MRPSSTRTCCSTCSIRHCPKAAYGSRAGRERFARRERLYQLSGCPRSSERLDGPGRSSDLDRRGNASSGVHSGASLEGAAQRRPALLVSFLTSALRLLVLRLHDLGRRPRGRLFDLAHRRPPTRPTHRKPHNPKPVPAARPPGLFSAVGAAQLSAQCVSAGTRAPTELQPRRGDASLAHKLAQVSRMPCPLPFRFEAFSASPRVRPTLSPYAGNHYLKKTRLAILPDSSSIVHSCDENESATTGSRLAKRQ